MSKILKNIDYKFTPDFWNRFFKKEHYYKKLTLLGELKLLGYLNFLKNLDINGSFILKTDLYVEAKNEKDNFFPFLKINKCLGMDLSLEVTRAARRNLLEAHPNMKFVVADVRNLPFKKDSFDAIISDSTLDHLPVNKLPMLLGGLKSILKQKGRLILSLNNSFNFTITIFRIIENLHNYYVSFSFNRLRVNSLLKAYSFKIIDWDYIIPVDYPGVFLVKYSKKMKIVNFMALVWLSILEKAGKSDFLKKFFCIHFIILAEKN